MSFADQLKEERERLGITQAQAASLLDVPARTYWEWEAAKTTPYAVTQEGCLARLRPGPRRRNESHEQLADACGVSRRTVEGWEQDRMPTAAALNVMSTLV